VSKHLKKPTKRTKRFPRLTLIMVLLATAILAIAAVTVVSRQKARANGASEAERSLQVAKKSKGNFVTVNVAGQDVQVDGQTGQIQQLTPEEAQKLAAGLKQMVNQSTEGLVQVQHADGSVSMDLEGRFQNVAVARVNKDGSVTQSCVDNPQAAGAFFGIDPKLIEDSNTRPIENQPNPKVVEKQQ
jgi:Tfp pilus assembly protein FimT